MINFFKTCSYTVLAVLAVDLLATSGDITMTWPSPMLSKLYSNDSDINPLPKPITKQEDAFIVSLINIGAMFGSLPFGYIGDHFGRKYALLIIGLFHMTAYISMAFAKTVYLFYFGRLIGGLAVGGGYTLLPMYIAEIAEESKRGAYSTTLAIFWAFGNFLPYLIGPFISVKIFNLVSFCFPVAFFVIFFLVGPETPYFLVGAGKLDKAEKVLMLLRSKNSKEVQEELNYIKNSLEQEDESTSSIRTICSNRGVVKAFIISISLITFQQLSGWNAITAYLQPIFEASGTNLSADISSIVIGAAIFGFSLPSPYFSDKFGRKPLLIYSNVVIGICLILLGAFFLVQTRTDLNTKYISWLPIASLVVLVFAFQIGLACLPWTISSELFPKNVKKLSASATSSACWLASFLMTVFFNSMTEALGKDGTFFLFAGCCFICVIFIILQVPETRGKTFTEIQQILQR